MKKQQSPSSPGCVEQKNAAELTATLPKQTVLHDFPDALIQKVMEGGQARWELIILAAFLTCAYRYSGSEEFDFWLENCGSAIKGQPCHSAFRANLSGSPTFQELTRRLSELCSSTFSAQQLANSVDETGNRHRLSLKCQKAFVFYVNDLLSSPNRAPGFDNVCSPAAVKVSCPCDVETTTIGLEFVEKRHPPELIAQFLASLQVLVQGLAQTHDMPIGQLPITSPAMLRKIVNEFNRPGNDYPRAATIHDLFEEQARQRPDSIALIFGARRLTYGELNCRANQLAHFLTGQGVLPGDRVAICLDRSIDAIVGILAILKSGAAYVPLDAAYPEERLNFILADTAAPFLISSGKFAEKFRTFSGKAFFLDRLQTTLAKLPFDNPENVVGSEEVAYIMYTSGSTGTAKGVQIVHRGVVRLVKNTDYVEILPDDIFLQFASLSFDASTFEIWAPLLNGACLEIFPPGLPSLSELAEKVSSAKVTVLWLTAGLFQQMVDYQLNELLGVRQLLTGGDVVSPTHARKFLERALDCKLVNGYGPTENTTFTCCFPMRSVSDVGVNVSIGRPIVNTQVYVMDSSAALLPPGAAGELMIGGDGLARDYLNDPQLTETKFVTRIVDNVPVRLYHSGDKARWNIDGTLEFLGRIDRQVKVRGFRVEPGEIESALKGHPLLNDVVVQPSDKSGRSHLVAYVTSLHMDDADIVSDVRNWLSAKLPDFMIPAEFVVLDRFPLTTNGKIDRKSLSGLSRGTVRVTREFVAPTTDLEVAIAEIWKSVFGLDRVGIHDDFFSLGGDSLNAMEISVLVQKHVSLALKPSRLLERRTIAGIVSSMDENEPDQPAIPARYGKSNRPAKLTSVQQGLWFLDRYDPDSRAYTILLAYQIKGPIDADRLSICFQRVALRHEILRTIFRNGRDGPEQVVQAENPFRLEQTDLSGLSETSRLVEWERHVTLAGRTPFDLGCPPLMRAHLLKWSPDQHRLLLSVHHMVFDGWSEGVLFRELNRFYELAGDQSRANPSPELAIQYRDYAHWQQQRLESDEFGQELSYWKKQLAGAPKVLNLSIARKRPARQKFVGRTRFTSLSWQQEKQIEQLGAREGATLFMTLMTTFLALLHRYSDRDDMVVGTAVANRNHPAITDLIGFFANTLPLRVNLAGTPTFRQLLQKVKLAMLDLFVNQTVPMNKLVEELNVERNTAWSPLFQVALVFHNTSTAHLTLPGMEVTRIPVDPGTAKFDLTLTVVPTSEGLQLAWEYNTDLFDDESLARFARDFGELLSGVIADPDGEIDRLLPVERVDGVVNRDAPIKHIPPRELAEVDTVLEAELSRIWKKLLQVDRIARDENFFHIGGDSLLAIALALEIERSLGKKIPIALLFGNNTIASQVQLLCNADSESNVARLIPLSTTGIGAPVILLPNIGGNALTFRVFVDLIRGMSPVYTLQLESDFSHVQQESMERLAGRCVDLFLNSGFDSPVHLAGYSFGGMLAYEVARQLSERGMEVGVVGIIDTGPSQPVKAAVGPLATFASQFGKNLPGWIVFNLLDPKELLQKIGRKTRIIKQRLRSVFGSQDSVEDNVNPDHIFDMKNRSESERALVGAHLTAFFKYKPGSYLGPITVFRARVRPLLHSLEPDLGWSHICSGEVTVRNVPGGHKNILTGQQGFLVAKLLMAQIDEYENTRMDANPDSGAIDIG